MAVSLIGGGKQSAQRKPPYSGTKYDKDLNPYFSFFIN
jgi:hypothetical protein